jgi:Zn-dependent protease
VSRNRDFSTKRELAVRLCFCGMSKSVNSPFARTPILDSGILPLRKPREITVVTILGIIGGSVIVLIQALIQPKIGILLYFAALTVAILIHELGHLTAGWCVGFRFRCIAVGPFALHLERGRLKLRLLRELTVSGYAGYAGMEVDTVVRLRRRLLLFIVAGPAANLITVPIAVLFSNHTSLDARHPLFPSFAAPLMMVSVLISVLNLLPFPAGPTSFTDGFRIATLLRDRERTRRLLSIYAVGAQRLNGKPPNNWKKTWLKAASSVCDDSVDDFWGNWLAYTSCFARNDGGLGAVHLERCLQLSGWLTETIRDSTAQQAACFSALFRRDTPLAQKWLKETRRWNSRKLRFAEPSRKVQFPASARRINIWSEST